MVRLLALVLIFTAFFFYGKSKGPLKFQKEGISLTQSLIEGVPLPFMKRTHLTNEALGPGPKSEELSLAELKKRFLAPYTKNSEKLGPNFHEATSRILTLKKIQSAFNDHEKKSLHEFYTAILNNPNEQWVVKRQALQNALLISSHLSEQERDQLIARTPSSLLILASKSERELIDEVVSRAQK